LPFVKDYYAQRASVPGTLLITEATFISPRASGYPNVPGIWNAEQIEAWKEVTKAVHEKGSYIFLQLWALGRAANPKALKELGDYQVVSSSPTPEKETSPVPHELSVDEIRGFVGDYAQAAKNSIDGYLVDQFTQDTCNKRTDAYGGSIENRSRFGLEVAKAVVEAVGADRTGIRLSPFSPFQGMKMTDPIPQFSHLLTGLKALGLAYIHVVESRIAGNADVESTEKVDFALNIWGKTSPILIAGGFKPDSARRAVDEEYEDNDVAIVFGRYYISNPDLPFRLKNDVELTKYNRDTFYKTKSVDGYTDYPFSREYEQSSRL
jgi:NADPH2 dehydrogenase